MSFWNQQKELHKKLSDESKNIKYDTPLSDYKMLSQEAYKKKPRRDIGDWHLLYDGYNNKVYQNRNTLEITQAISGSKSIGDFANDGLQLLGFNNNSLQKKRLKESENVFKAFDSIAKKPKTTFTGHSLGSNIANNLILKGHGSKTFNFNPFIPSNRINIDDDRVVNIRNENDFASTKTRNNQNTINLEKDMNPISSHFLDNVDL
jgi:hypothetical protein